MLFCESAKLIFRIWRVQFHFCRVQFHINCSPENQFNSRLMITRIRAILKAKNSQFFEKLSPKLQTDPYNYLLTYLVSKQSTCWQSAYEASRFHWNAVYLVLCSQYNKLSTSNHNLRLFYYFIQTHLLALNFKNVSCHIKR